MQKKADGKTQSRLRVKNEGQVVKAEVIEVKKSGVQQKVETGFNQEEVLTGSVEFVESRKEKLQREEKKEEKKEIKEKKVTK